MKKLKRLFSLSVILIVFATLCVSNISSSSYFDSTLNYYYYDNVEDKIYVNTGDFEYIIDKDDTSKATITNIKEGINVLNIPETVTFNNIVYPLKDLYISSSEGYSLFELSLQTINISKNIESINLVAVGEHNGSLSALKTINIPSGAKLKSIALPSCPNLEKINLPSDSKLEDLSISGCPKLKKLSLPKTLKFCSVGEDAPKLKVKIAKGNNYLKVKGNQILSKGGKKIIDIFGKKSKVTVYKTVKVIGDYIAQNKYLKKLIIGENVTKFSRDALSLRKNLKVILKSKNKIPKIKKDSFWFAKNIKFYVENEKVAKELKSQLKGSKIKKAKILIGKKVVYKNVKG